MHLKKLLLIFSIFWVFLSFSQSLHSPFSEEVLTVPQIKAPCDLKKIAEKKQLPTIKIYGENHASSESKKLHEELTFEARRGECVVGLEGVLCSNSQHILRDYLLSVTRREPIPGDQNRFFGIEDEMAFCLAILLKNHNEAKKYQAQGNLDALSNLITKTKKDLNRYAFFREVFEKFKNKDTDQVSTRSQKFFINYLSDNLKNQPQEPLKDIEKKLNEMLQGLPQSLEALTLTMIDTIKSKKTKTSRYVPADLEKLVKDYFKSEDASLVTKTVTLEWRNFIFSENVLKAYCLALSKENTPKSFDVVVGKLHVPGIEKLLKENFEGTLSSKVLTSYLPYKVNKSL